MFWKLLARMNSWVKTRRSQMICRTSSSANSGRSIGKVTLQKLRQPLAPSTFAASYSSCGMLFSPASTETATNGNACQTITMISTENSGTGSRNQLKSRQPEPTSQSGIRSRVTFTRPRPGMNSQRNTSEALIAGVAQASIMPMATVVENHLGSLCSRMPTRVPSTRVMPTIRTHTTTVLARMRQKVGSLSRVW